MHIEEDSDGQDIIGMMRACFGLTRGISTLVDAHRSSIEGTWAGDMINLDANKALERSRHAGLRFDQSHLLEETIRARVGSGTDLEAHLNAAIRCTENIELLLSRPDEQDEEVYHLIMTWPNEMCERYMQALERRESLALVILAHFAVLMSLRRRQWWFTAWPRRVLQAVCERVGEDYSAVLRWPQRTLARPPE